MLSKCWTHTGSSFLLRINGLQKSNKTIREIGAIIEWFQLFFWYKSETKDMIHYWLYTSYQHSQVKYDLSGTSLRLDIIHNVELWASSSHVIPVKMNYLLLLNRESISSNISYSLAFYYHDTTWNSYSLIRKYSLYPTKKCALEYTCWRLLSIFFIPSELQDVVNSPIFLSIF